MAGVQAAAEDTFTETTLFICATFDTWCKVNAIYVTARNEGWVLVVAWVLISTADLLPISACDLYSKSFIIDQFFASGLTEYMFFLPWSFSNEYIRFSHLQYRTYWVTLLVACYQ